MTTEDFVREIVIPHCLENGGGTFDLYKQSICDYGKGYFVAKSGCDEEVVELTENNLLDYISHYKLEEYGDALLGVWLDPETEIWFFDTSEWHIVKAVTENIAKRNNQIAYWDCEKKEEVYINEG